MRENQCITIQSKKKTKELLVHRVAFYHVMKVMEAYDESNQCYLLFFYKDHYLTYKKCTTIGLDSRLKAVFSNGIILDAPHPLITALIDQKHSFTFQSFNPLLQKLENQYSNKETSLIFSFFDTFMQREKLIHLMKNYYNEYRRNGQFFKAYQILRICLDYAPDNNWAKDMSHNLQYHSYETIFDEGGPALLAKDPLFAELQLFQSRTDSNSLFALLELLALEGRWTDGITLYIESLSTSNSIDERMYDAFLSLLSSHLSNEECAHVLSNLLEKGVQHPAIQQTLIDYLIKLGKYEDAINSITTNPSLITPVHYRQVQHLLEKEKLDATKLQIEHINYLLIHEAEPRKLEKLLRLCIPLLLKKYDFTYIRQWLEPLRKLNMSLPVLQKVTFMQTIKDDPERQLLLGELYYEFKQYEQAIECFSFEMELKPNDPKPVQWLAKVYKELGMAEESLSYQNVLSMMQKRA